MIVLSLAARLCCHLDSARDVLLLRPFGPQSSGPSFPRPAAGSAASSASSPSPSDESDLPLGRLPASTLRPMTYKAAVDLSHFLKEKGGLEGLIHSQRRQDLLFACTG
ncbi:hypothetical protein EK468_24975, partial [Citrobacter braakii]|nr:hypothetical protein [Citrobacter braakii]